MNQFLYSAVSGLPDCTSLNKDSEKVLLDTYRMMMEQIEHDATPEFLNELKSNICVGHTEDSHQAVANLARVLQDKSLNPLSLPFEYLLNGNLPFEEINDKPIVQTSFLKSSPTKAPTVTDRSQ